ncbi:MAG: acetyl-CoA synthase subunit gamma [Firmicutes bacterium]|nr:acetyl-CoA synthase subunit gamma [Bacillota bacterium]
MTQKDEVIDNKWIKHSFDGHLNTKKGLIKRIKTFISLKDKLLNAAVRLGVNRNNYKIQPGIYAVGNPNEKSQVLVTSNYKLTFDELRKNLDRLDVWILVLDTKGINVWCAAGKGTFSTEELIYRIKKHKIDKLVTHKNLILPQLSAPGVSSYKVTKYVGFKINYGPVKARDINKFLNNKMTKDMRKVTFNLKERLLVTPLEFVYSVKYIPFIILFFLFLNILSGSSLIDGLKDSIINIVPYIGAIFIGTILFPMLIPILPFRIFSFNGILLGIIYSVLLFNNRLIIYDKPFLWIIGNSLLLISIIAYLAMNFTGSTTFTSHSGVRRETIITIPILLLLVLSGIILIILNAF